MLRHCIVTNTRNLSSPEKNNLAVKMGHSRTTADRWYNLVNKMKASTDAHTTVTSLMDGMSTSFEGNDDEVPLPDIEEKEDSAVDEQCKVRDEDTSECSTNIIAPSENAYEDKKRSVFSFRRHWSQVDVEKLNTICTYEITCKEVPTRATIVKRLQSKAATKEIVDREGVERTYQKVKHMRRSHQNGKHSLNFLKS